MKHPEIERGNRGAHNEMLAAVWLLRHGYSVFRNVSFHGPVDIIGMKDGETFHFDVKSSPFTVAGERSRARLKPEQVAMGVKVINVFPDDTCDIDWSPIGSMPAGDRICEECGTQFRAQHQRHVWCSDRCRQEVYMKKHGKLPNKRRKR